jgi:hypothetical protein
MDKKTGTVFYTSMPLIVKEAYHGERVCPVTGNTLSRACTFATGIGGTITIEVTPGACTDAFRTIIDLDALGSSYQDICGQCSSVYAAQSINEYNDSRYICVP